MNLTKDTLFLQNDTKTLFVILKNKRLLFN